ncbi:MAG: peptide chain release factor N(5)-glutamine methyltransferase [Gammaproteobacteria bacterium]
MNQSFITITDALSQACGILTSHSPEPRLDAELLLKETLQCSRAYLYTYPTMQLTTAQTADFFKMIARRKVGEPVAYILGRAAFWTLELHVTPATLIPRPETELLVELALQLLPAEKTLTLADLGTGSGAIALALASERPHWELHASDQSATALTVAQGNAHRLALTNVQFHLGDWCAALPKQRFHALISNPPYIALSEPHWQQGDLRFEPQSALIAGEDGLQALRIIIQQAEDYLEVDGWLMFEHGYQQQSSVVTLLQQSGYQSITSHQDKAGHWRVTMGRK